ncbi:nucleotidyl transferase AbiEii/AbiGii toxin family protein [Agromyces italicus]|uniref:nucleotidyl transferase AbiEii/AbiGii toxin family protein n=1 Tax=Agromyces italicus TaxID=279572 RepID=UPI0003B5B25C|nr:nucleotidyl transferase AbiEii/AbiGii toxin family protein [Agromyces italicus]
MLDFARTDPRLLDDVADVVDSLVTHAAIDPASVMLVGARCRDAIHSALGAPEPTRATEDLDIGLALDSWEAFERIDHAFPRLGNNGIRFRIAGLPVDVMPFGAAIERPDGITNPASRGESLVVFGFEDVFARAMRIRLPGQGHEIRIPSPPGYGVLKTRAWVDRSIDHEYKDAADPAVALRWYESSPNITDRLFDDALDMHLTEQYEFDQRLSTAHLLGRDIRRQLSSGRGDELAEAFDASDLSMFARQLGSRVGGLAVREELTRAFATGLSDDS